MKDLKGSNFPAVPNAEGSNYALAYLEHHGSLHEEMLVLEETRELLIRSYKVGPLLVINGVKTPINGLIYG